MELKDWCHSSWVGMPCPTPYKPDTLGVPGWYYTSYITALRSPYVAIIPCRSYHDCRVLASTVEIASVHKVLHGNYGMGTGSRAAKMANIIGFYKHPEQQKEEHCGHPSLSTHPPLQHSEQPLPKFLFPERAAS